MGGSKLPSNPVSEAFELDAFHTATEECIYWMCLQFEESRAEREAWFTQACVIRALPEPLPPPSFAEAVRATGGTFDQTWTGGRA